MQARKIHREAANMIGKYIIAVAEITAAVTFTGAAVMVILFSFRLVLEVFAL